MGASEKARAAYHPLNMPTPGGRSGVQAVLAAADTIRDRVLGFIVQCETCPQKAVVATQPQAGWVCPRCTDAHGDDVSQAEPGLPLPNLCHGFGLETGHDMGLSHAAEMFPQHQRNAAPCSHQAVRYGVCADCGSVPQYPWGAAIPAADDDYPIGKVRG